MWETACFCILSALCLKIQNASNSSLPKPQERAYGYFLSFDILRYTWRQIIVLPLSKVSPGSHNVPNMKL